MLNYLPPVKFFLEHFQTDETLKPLRKFVNVYGTNEQDIQAIDQGGYEISNLKAAPESYGGKNVFSFSVGKTSFRIWGAAAEHIQQQAGQQSGSGAGPKGLGL